MGGSAGSRTSTRTCARAWAAIPRRASSAETSPASAVSVVQHDAADGTNQLDAARQAAQSQTATREQAERRLAEAQGTIRDLRTQLAHERLARDEAAQRAAGEKEAAAQELTSLQAELLTVRATLQQTEQRLQGAAGEAR
jgi:chromosome segregation ATPase